MILVRGKALVGLFLGAPSDAALGQLRCGATAARNTPTLTLAVRRAVLALGITRTRCGANLPTRAKLAAAACS